MKSTVKQMGVPEWFFLLSLSVLWGGSFFFVEVALKALPPFTIVFLRVGVAALILHAVVLFIGQSVPKGMKIWRDFMIMGLLNNVIPFCLIVWGQKIISGGLASILNAATPFSTVIAAHFLTSDEKLNLNKVLGVLIGFAGVAVLIGIESLRSGDNLLIGQMAVLAAGCSYAFAGIFGRRFKSYRINPIVTATGQLTGAAILLIPVTLLIDHPWSLSLPGADVWGAVGAMAALSTALAYILYFRILSSAGATNVLLVTFLIPVSAIILGVIFLGEFFGQRHFLGIVLIGCGLIAIDGRLFKRSRKRGKIK